MLRRRFEGLGPSAVDVTQALAVLDGKSSIRRILAVANRDEAEIIDVIDRLAEADILDVDKKISFRHSVVRQAVLVDIGPAHLDLLHRRAIQALLDEGESAEMIAPHLLECEPVDPHAGVEILTQAGLVATERGAPEMAAAFLDRASELGDVASDVRVRRALLLLEQLDLVRAWGDARITGDTLRRLGVIYGDERGLANTGEAVGLLRSSEVRLGLGYALASHGQLLLKNGFRQEAENSLLEGLEIAVACGSVRLESRIRDGLSAIGRRPRRVARRGPDALTASEQRVAGRAAAGMTNREIGQELFISTKTVEKHLANSYRKLGIASRRELVTALMDSSSGA